MEGGRLLSLGPDAVAVVVGASGGIGAALVDALQRRGGVARVIALSRREDPPLDLLDEGSIAAAAARADAAGPVRLVLDATGVLSGGGARAERGWREMDTASLAQAFAVNAIGPALLMKHFLPLFAAGRKAVFATLSARVGSIADNRLGGWYGYRASKAALNQLVRTAAVELARRRPQAICLALHPGTVDTPLSRPFVKQGLAVRLPAESAGLLLDVIEGATPAQSGLFLDYHGAPIPW